MNTVHLVWSSNMLILNDDGIALLPASSKVISCTCKTGYYARGDNYVILLTTVIAAMLEVYGLHQCNVVNLRVLANSCVWNCTLVEKTRPANNTGIRIFRFPYFSSIVFTLSIPPTWRRVMTLTSMMSVHLMCPCAAQHKKCSSKRICAVMN